MIKRPMDLQTMYCRVEMGVFGGILARRRPPAPAPKPTPKSKPTRVVKPVPAPAAIQDLALEPAGASFGVGATTPLSDVAGRFDASRYDAVDRFRGSLVARPDDAMVGVVANGVLANGNMRGNGGGFGNGASGSAGDGEGRSMSENG